MGFNSGFKGLKNAEESRRGVISYTNVEFN